MDGAPDMLKVVDPDGSGSSSETSVAGWGGGSKTPQSAHATMLHVFILLWHSGGCLYSDVHVVHSFCTFVVGVRLLFSPSTDRSPMIFPSRASKSEFPASIREGHSNSAITVELYRSRQAHEPGYASLPNPEKPQEIVSWFEGPPWSIARPFAQKCPLR